MKRYLWTAWVACAAGVAAAPPQKPQRVAIVSAAPAGQSYASSEAMRSFAAAVAARRGLDESWVVGALAQAQRVPAVQRLIMPPAAGTAKNWAAYRERFVEPQRIAAGLAWWRTHRAWLEDAETRWGVPAELVVAIVGVETYYGRISGNFRIVDALATLSFDFPAGRSDRSGFFRSELEEFLVWARREGLDPASVKGSFAGAIGLPQFMPGSINRYAIDFDGDGHIDLRGPAAGSTARAGGAPDVVGSVAHFLAQHGWEKGLPTHYAVKVPVDSSDRATLLAPDISPTFSAAQFAERGAVLDDAGRAHDGPLALVELQNGAAAPSYVAGTKNFYVVTRYNWSSYYALAVIDLAQALKAADATNAGRAAAPAGAMR